MVGPAIDSEALLVRTLGRQDLAYALLALFRDDAPATLAGVRVAVDAGDADAVARHLHRLKGSAKTIGADTLARLVTAAEADHAAGRPAAVGAVGAELTRCVDEIEHRLGRGA